MEEAGEQRKEEIAEDYCFVCKDGGTLLLCEHRYCRKAYHPQCVGKDESFLEAGEHWTCSWHSCFICHKHSSLQCFCCPNSVCKECIRSSVFIQLKKTKGFCSNCLKLVLMIEENADVDSDGCEVDFNDTDTYEFLFKDYWEIVKDEEKLNLKDLQEAEDLSKKGRSYGSGFESDQISEEEGQFMLDTDDMSFPFSESTPVRKGKGRQHMKKSSLKGHRSKKRNFRGWGSVELIEFLTYLGEDTKEPLKQWDCHKIVENYIQVNNLLQPNKKKKTVLCDERLRSLFRKKTVKHNKIYNLLEDHFASNKDSYDESLSGSEEDLDLIVSKQFQQLSSDNVQRNKTRSEPEPSKSCYASMIDQNVKLVYLRRSLIKEFLHTSETLERKVVGCFVRVKRDRQDFDYSPHKVYQLGQVYAMKKVPNVYMVGEISTDIVLCVSNIWRDVCIYMLSDDDFEEEECEELRHLVKKGLFKRPTVAELEEKIRSIHEDIMSHWIKREIAILQRQIDRANEKGWRGEKCEYIERRALLQTDAEQARLLKQIPKVIPDLQEFVDNPDSQPTFQRENKGTATFYNEDAERNASGNGEGIHVELKKNEEVDKHKSTDMENSCEDVVVIEIDGDDEPPIVGDHLDEIILGGDEDEVLVLENTSEISNTLENTPEAICEHKRVWYYVDPSGTEQGPFTMAVLRFWREKGFFDDDFRVWRAGELPEDAILLTEALLMTNIEN